MKLADLRISVVPGDGIVARLADAVLVVPFDESVDQAAVDRLLLACAEGSLGLRLADVLGTAGTGVPSFALVAEVDGGLAVHVVGDAQAAIAGLEPVLRLSGRAPGWSGYLRESFTSLAVGRDVDADPANVPARLDLRAGVVAGAGALLRPRPAVTAVQAPPPVEAPPAVEVAPPEVVEPAGAPEVWGVRCKKGHFNDPDARYCAMCGIHMVQEKAVRVKGPRPVLGYLVVDDGSTYKLDTDYVIGRDPHGHDDVRSGQARPLVIGVGEEVISEVHARITLQDWDVFVADCHSVYGTYVWAPGTTAWERLNPDAPVRLTAGSQVMLAQRSFMFQPVNKR